MPYKNAEDQKAASRRHYLLNKNKYNPSRELYRDIGAGVKEWAYKESMLRWVSPDEIKMRCRELLLGHPQWIIDKAFARATNATPGMADGGIFLGSSPFMPPIGWTQPERFISNGNRWARAEFLKQLPKRKTNTARAEVLILQLIAKRMIKYGYESTYNVW